MILLTGATGFLGGHIVDLLLTQGHPLRLLVRRTNHPALARWQDQITQGRIQLVEGGLHDLGSLHEAFEGTTHVIHSAASIAMQASQRREMYQTNVEGTANIVNFALEYGVQRLVHISSIAAFGKSERAHTLTEADTYQPDKSNYAYAETKYQAELEVQRAVEEGLDAVICNPGVIIGPGDWTGLGSPQILRKVNQGLSFYTTGVNGYVGVWDVARAAVLLLHGSEAPGTRYILVADNLSFKQCFEQAAVALGVKAPSRPAPEWLLPFAGSVSGAVSRLVGANPLFTRDTARTLTGKHYYDGSAITRAYPEYAYMPMKEVFARSARELAELYPGQIKLPQPA